MDYFRRLYKSIKIAVIRLWKGSEHSSVYSRLNTHAGDNALINPVWTYLKRIFTVRHGVITLIGYILAGVMSWHSHFELVKPSLETASKYIGFELKHIEVEGQSRLTDNEIIAALNITTPPSVLFLDVEEARSSLESMERVRSASVSRHFPDTLKITLEERKPFAIWQLEKQLIVIDQDGVNLGGWQAGLTEDLPLVVGENAQKSAFEVVEIIKNFSEINARTHSFIRVADRRWNLQLDANMKIMLPEDGMIKAVAKLNKLHNDHELLDRDLEYIDLRLPDRIIAKPIPNLNPDTQAEIAVFASSN